MRDAAGKLLAGPDPQTRTALAMSSDLGTLFLADHWRQVLGHDPRHVDGLARWADEAMRFYAAILPAPDTGADDDIGTHPPWVIPLGRYDEVAASWEPHRLAHPTPGRRHRRHPALGNIPAERVDVTGSLVAALGGLVLTVLGVVGFVRRDVPHR